MSDVGLFESLRAKHGPNLVAKGRVNIKLHDHLPDIKRDTHLLCEGINKTFWWIYTKPGNYLTIDFLVPRLINKIQTHNEGDYLWAKYPPSYAIEFSNDDVNYKVMYEEKKSNRKEIDSFFTFTESVKYRYVRLRETDYASDYARHGQYISWFEFFPGLFQGNTPEIKRQTYLIHVFIDCLINSSII